MRVGAGRSEDSAGGSGNKLQSRKLKTCLAARIIHAPQGGEAAVARRLAMRIILSVMSDSCLAAVRTAGD